MGVTQKLGSERPGLPFTGGPDEVGSEFHWFEAPSPRLHWPSPARYYSLGRHTVAALLSHLAGRGKVKLWVPDYFCHDVAAYWQALCHLRSYEDDPRWETPRWRTLRPGPKDLVVAVNYFGVRDGEPWQEWRSRNPCVLIEDHSHDPLSSWALRSRADYAFSSIRKTLPVPDGAIMWSPRRRTLPDPPVGKDWAGVRLKFLAMVCKAEYLHRRSLSSLKKLYRKLQLDGETRLVSSEISAPFPASVRYLRPGIPSRWRNRRVANVKYLLHGLHDWQGGRPIFQNWPKGNAPFGAVFVFPSVEDRERARAKLSRGGVYCPVHWPAVAGANERVRKLAGMVLTIPTDQRYGTKHMDRIVSLLAEES